jgi:septal ring factor EnvC (AmiA/AmiB activator)
VVLRQIELKNRTFVWIQNRKNMRSGLGKNISTIVLAVFLLSFAALQNGFAQTNKKKQLKNKQQKIEKKISYTKKLLNETKNQKKTTLTEYKLLRSQVQDRKALIRTYNNEVSMLDRQINDRRKQIEQLKKDLEILKKEYADLIYQSYKSRNSYDQWMFIFASEDFYQAFNRMKYLQEFNNYRRGKAETIQETSRQLEQEIQELEKKKNERLGVLIVKEEETRNLEKDSRKKEDMVRKLKEQEQKLRRQLQQQEREWKKLDKEIQRLIQIELDKQSKKSGKLPLTPEEQLLSDNFTANKGKLPWPSERGIIVSRFGVSDHGQLHVKVNNRGVDIRCEKGSAARAVFSGVVVKVIQLPKYKAVLVRHGDYYTVYNRLSAVYVHEGDKVQTKQKIGTVWTESDSGETILHFELRKSKDAQNPERWIAPR